MVSNLFTLLLAPAIVTATSLEYYRSAFCDTQSSRFLIDRYTAADSLVNDKTCHQTPARTMAVKLVDGLDPACVVFAYDDYGCSSLVGAVPANGKCVAATKARIGSWQLRCNSTADVSPPSASGPHVSGELRRRDIGPDKSAHPPNVHTGPRSSFLSVAQSVASSVASEISSAVNASATKDVAATITSTPSAGAALSSAITSGTGIATNLTSYVTPAPNSSTVMSTLLTTTASSTVTFTGTRSSNGTAVLQVDGSSSNLPGGREIMITALCGALAVLVAVTL